MSAGNVQKKLNGKWIKVLSPGDTGHKPPFEHLSAGDLDDMARNYRQATEKIPVGIDVYQKGSETLGQVDQLKVDGGDLFAKVGQIHPKLEDLYADNALPKTNAIVRKTPAGYALERVGFNSPFTGPRMNIDQIHAHWFTPKEVAMSENPASRTISRMKERGVWCAEFDESGIPEIFNALRGSNQSVEFGEGDNKSSLPLLGAFSHFLEVIFPYVKSSKHSMYQGNNAELVPQARKLSHERGISFGEALLIADQRREDEAEAYTLQFSEQGRRKGFRAELASEAKRRAFERNMSYGDALLEVARERPDLTLK